MDSKLGVKVTEVLREGLTEEEFDMFVDYIAWMGGHCPPAWIEVYVPKVDDGTEE